MFLSNHDIKWAVQTGRLICKPPPEEMGGGYDETSIDLHLDKVEEAYIWDIEKLKESEGARGSLGPEVKIGTFDWTKFSRAYLIPPPEEPVGQAAAANGPKVFRRGQSEVVVRPNGFLLWQTKEKVGTPVKNPGMICFVDGKSTRARTGILVHLTAPTIHAGWSGNIVLEIVNLGPFHFVLREDDVIAQLTVAMVANPPNLELKKGKSATADQAHVSGKKAPAAAKKKKR